MNIRDLSSLPTAMPSALHEGGLMRLAGRRGLRITSRRGTLWVTQDRDPNDVVLVAGESHTLEADGPVLIQALEHASVTIEPAPARPGWRAWWRAAWPVRPAAQCPT